MIVLPLPAPRSTTYERSTTRVSVIRYTPAGRYTTRGFLAVAAVPAAWIALLMAAVASVVPLPKVVASMVVWMVVTRGTPPGMPGFHVVRRSDGRIERSIVNAEERTPAVGAALGEASATPTAGIASTAATAAVPSRGRGGGAGRPRGRGLGGAGDPAEPRAPPRGEGRAAPPAGRTPSAAVPEGGRALGGEKGGEPRAHPLSAEAAPAEKALLSLEAGS